MQNQLIKKFITDCKAVNLSVDCKTAKSKCIFTKVVFNLAIFKILLPGPENQTALFEILKKTEFREFKHAGSNQNFIYVIYDQLGGRIQNSSETSP